MKTTPTNVSGAASDCPLSTAPIRMPVATAMSAGSRPRSSRITHHAMARPGAAWNSARKNWYSCRARSRRMGGKLLTRAWLTPSSSFAGPQLRRGSGGGAEPFDADAVHRHAEVDEQVARGVGEPGRAAHVRLGIGPDVRLEVGAREAGGCAGVAGRRGARVDDRLLGGVELA